MMWNRPFDMMYGWSDWGWFGPLHFVVPLLFWTLVVTAIIFVVRRGFRSGQASLVGHRLTSLELLEQRYARGEINRDEYLFSSETEDAISASRGGDRVPAPKRSMSRAPNTTCQTVASPMSHCEPVSAVNSLLTGKNTGKFTNPAPFEARQSLRCADALELSVAIPSIGEQGILGEETGKPKPRTGNLSEIIRCADVVRPDRRPKCSPRPYNWPARGFIRARATRTTWQSAPADYCDDGAADGCAAVEADPAPASSSNVTSSNVPQSGQKYSR